MQYRAKRRDNKEMRPVEATKKGLCTGVVAGLLTFALAGLLPGSFIGGVIGMRIAGWVFGLPLRGFLLPRLIVALAMFTGVMLSGMAFVTGGGLTGWVIGHVIDTFRARNTMAIGCTHTVKGKFVLGVFED
jgi:hypothetical protein